MARATTRTVHRWVLATSALAAAAALVLPGTAAAAGSTSSGAPSTAQSTADRHVSYHQWVGGTLYQGARVGVHPTNDKKIRLNPKTTGRTDYADPFDESHTTRTYDSGTWTSPVQPIGFGATEAVASWNATTPTGTWLQVKLRGQRSSDGGWTKWYTMGNWTSGDDFAKGDIHRTSVPKQGDDDGYVSVDTFVAEDGVSIGSYQLQVTLLRPHGATSTPALAKIGLMASALPDTATVPTSPFTLKHGVDLNVPEFSQDVHVGEFPEYDNGGEAWCSPTSTSMAVYYWHRKVPAADLARMQPQPPLDPQVDYAARYVFDYDYDGAGNWPFNAAYAAEFPKMNSFVTRLRSLSEAEQFVKAGIPLVISVSFKAEDMDGAGYSTSGHLFVIAGFTDDGDVIVNDPATGHDDTVTRVYKRSQVENAWVPHSGGIAYVYYPQGTQLPKNVSSEHNW